MMQLLDTRQLYSYMLVYLAARTHVPYLTVSDETCGRQDEILNLLSSITSVHNICASLLQ